MLTFSQRVLRALVGALLLFSSLAAAAAEPPSIQSFFQRKAMSAAALSPNGRYLAMRLATKGSRATLGVLDLASMTPVPVAAHADADIGMMTWINDERLVYTLTDLQVAQADAFGMPGLFAINRDGSNRRQLVERVRVFAKNGNSGPDMLPYNTFMMSAGQQNSDDIFVAKPESTAGGEWDYVQFQRVNTKTGRATDLDALPHTTGGLIDEQGVVRVVVTKEEGSVIYSYRDPATHAWRKLATFGLLDDNAFQFEWIDGKGDLFVRARNGGDKAAIYRYDLAANKLAAAPLVASNDFDIVGGAVHGEHQAIGYRYHIDGEVTQWLDRSMEAVQKRVDAALPDTTNRLSRGIRPQTPYVLVESFSDVQPSIFLLFNTDTGKLTKVGAANPDIDPRRMAMKDMVRIKARDGLTIPAYLSLPREGAKTKLPMVLLVHGGPWVRGGYWNFDPDAQFLASRGYAVLQPEFRGSDGFGLRHFKAGWKQWGLAMQDDVADAAKWAIAQGIADPKRICIAGASYGGYATLMGLVRDPGLFKCGIDWVGVTDINMLYTVKWSDATDSFKKFGMPTLVGDLAKDAAQFKATSPLENAARITQPLLLAYGGADVRVPLVHGTRFHDAVKAHNSQVEWVEYPKEGHGWALEETRIDFWSRVERFLAKHIGTP